MVLTMIKKKNKKQKILSYILTLCLWGILILYLVFIIRFNIVEYHKWLYLFCSNKTGIQEYECCDYHILFFGDVGCYMCSVDCGVD